MYIYLYLYIHIFIYLYLYTTYIRVHVHTYTHIGTRQGTELVVTQAPSLALDPPRPPHLSFLAPTPACVPSLLPLLHADSVPALLP